MWRAEQDAAASGVARGPPDIPIQQQVAISAFQHPSVNPTPFSTFPTAWVISPSSLGDAPSLPARTSTNATSLVQAPSDLLPNGLLTTPQPSTVPSTPATTLLKVLVNNRLSIPNQDGVYTAGSGQLMDSPATSGAHGLRPLDSLVLPSPSLLPGGVHSLPTPTSVSSQPLRPTDGYGSRGSPMETASSKDSVPSLPGAEASGSAKGSVQGSRPASAAANRRNEASSQQQVPRIGNSTGSNGTGVAATGRGADVSSSSTGTAGGQYPGSRVLSGAAAHNVGYGMQHGHGVKHPGAGGFQQHPQAPLAAAAAAAAAAVSQHPGSPTVGYSAQPYYLAPVAPGAVVMGMHPGVGGSAGGAVTGGSAAATRASAGGSNNTATGTREGAGSSMWNRARSAGGAGAHSGGASASGGGPGGKPSHQYGPPQQQQQMMPGSMVHGHDGPAGPYGMAHMHPGPYAVYGMMAPGIVMPQVLSPVVGSPRSMEAHGPLARQPVHMGPMVMPHGPAMGMGMGMGVSPAMHPFGHMGGPHIGMHPHMPHGGNFPHGHHFHSMGGGYGHGQPYGHAGGPGIHAHGGGYGGGGRGAGVKSAGSSAVAASQQKTARSGGTSSGAGAAPGTGAAAGSSTEAAGNLVSGTAGSARDSPVAARIRSGGREKTEGKAKSAEQRERKPGNSRAPVVIAQCAAEVPILEQQLQNLVQRLTPDEEELEAHQAALAAVRELVGQRWPEVKVHLFGSAASGLSIAGSNEIDITLEVADMAWDDHAAKAAMVSQLGELASGVPAPPRREPRAEETPGEDGSAGQPGAALVEAVASDGDERPAVQPAAGEVPTSPVKAEPREEKETVDEAGAAAETEAEAEATSPQPPRAMTAVSALPKARTPVVKMTVSATQTRVDITINNLLAISNTRLVRDYCKVDPRLGQLVLLVKHWARSRGVNDAYRGSLSSYAYALLCIWLLQQRQPAILPVLQQREPHTYDTTVGPWRCSYNDLIGEVQEFGAGNKETLAQLLVAFFDHWAWRHDYNGSVVCVRTGGTVTKTAKDWTKRQGNERHLMCIEDPFELSHDLGRTIDKAAVQVLRREFERAARIFASNPDPLPELLAPLTPEEEAAVAAALQSRRKASKEKDREKAKQAAAAAAAAAAASAAAGTEDGAVGALSANASGDAAGGDDAARDATGDGALCSRGSEGPDSEEGEDSSADGRSNEASQQ